MRPGGRQTAAWLGGAALVTASCNVLLGYDEGDLLPEPVSSGGGGSGTGGSTPTGTAGSGGATTITGAGAAGGPAGGAGGAGPTSCSLWPESAAICPASEKCTVVNESTGATACAPAGSVPAWARCVADADCQARLWCDHGTGVCKPLCPTMVHCPAGGNCLAAAASGGGPIPGLQICTSHCDPRNANSCNQTNGTTNCLYGYEGFDCFASGTSLYPSSCSSFLDCGPPHTCWGSICRPWCSVQAADCLLPQSCYAYSPPLYYDSTELG
jgi:hypothetical protein